MCSITKANELFMKGLKATTQYEEAMAQAKAEADAKVKELEELAALIEEVEVDEEITKEEIEIGLALIDTYREEVESLMKKLDYANSNYAREREAQRRANVEISAKKEAYKRANGVDMKAKDVKKISQQALTKYRKEVGTISRSDRSIKITDREWEAIQAGAISENKLKSILNNTDIKELRQRATPRTSNELSATKINRIKSYASSNYSLSQIAEKMNLSPTTVSKYLKGVK